MQSKHIIAEYIGANLSDLEKETILKLAKEGPLCGYDFHLGGKKRRAGRVAIMSSGYWSHIKKRLTCELKIITPIQLFRPERTDNRGRRKDTYWFTLNGIIYALGLGARVDDLKYWVKKAVLKPQESKSFLFFLELADILGLDLTVRFIKSHGMKFVDNNDGSVSIYERVFLGEEKVKRLIKLEESLPEKEAKENEKPISVGEPILVEDPILVVHGIKIDENLPEKEEKGTSE